VDLVNNDMTLTDIHQEIDRASERRADLWHILSQGYDQDAAAELKSLSQRLERLWDEERTLKAELRFGDRDHIVARARVEERLERAA
jgi:ABC-type phosphate transport system auxiliary subunit